MEAPEKIYLIRNISTSTALNTANDSHDKYLHEWYKSREKDADVEYTRTDKFIDVACEWISKHCVDECYLIRDNDGTWVDFATLLYDFRNYMKKNV